MTYASQGRDQEAKDALDQALTLHLPHILLQTLYLLEHDHPAFFQQYALPLLTE